MSRRQELIKAKRGLKSAQAKKNRSIRRLQDGYKPKRRSPRKKGGTKVVSAVSAQDIGGAQRVDPSLAPDPGAKEEPPNDGRSRESDRQDVVS